MRTRVRVVVGSLVTALAVGTMGTVGTAVAVPGADAPSKARWEADVHRALAGSREYVRERSREGGMLAINLDIDNTSLASHYTSGEAVADTLKLARLAERRGVLVYFNTARPTSGLPRARRMLEAAGYPVDRICGRAPDADVIAGKQACRAALVADGYTIIANIGNRPTDFAGGDYDRAFKLPDYDGALG